MPKGELAYVRGVSEDPNVKGLLFAGTGHALFYSLDDGGHWTQLKEGLPPAPADLDSGAEAFRPGGLHRGAASTSGRHHPLEQLATKPASDSVRLFDPRPTYRFARGENAFINFQLGGTPARR